MCVESEAISGSHHFTDPFRSNERRSCRDYKVRRWTTKEQAIGMQGIVISSPGAQQRHTAVPLDTTPSRGKLV